jgi:hypothetical protein
MSFLNSKKKFLLGLAKILSYTVPKIWSSYATVILNREKKKKASYQQIKPTKELFLEKLVQIVADLVPVAAHVAGALLGQHCLEYELAAAGGAYGNRVIVMSAVLHKLDILVNPAPAAEHARLAYSARMLEKYAARRDGTRHISVPVDDYGTDGVQRMRLVQRLDLLAIEQLLAGGRLGRGRIAYIIGQRLVKLVQLLLIVIVRFENLFYFR